VHTSPRSLWLPLPRFGKKTLYTTPLDPHLGMPANGRRLYTMNLNPA
jgi:hypothetical protein